MPDVCEIQFGSMLLGNYDQFIMTLVCPHTFLRDVCMDFSTTTIIANPNEIQYSKYDTFLYLHLFAIYYYINHGRYSCSCKISLMGILRYEKTG